MMKQYIYKQYNYLSLWQTVELNEYKLFDSIFFVLHLSKLSSDTNV